MVSGRFFFGWIGCVPADDMRYEDREAGSLVDTSLDVDLLGDEIAGLSRRITRGSVAGDRKNTSRGELLKSEGRAMGEAGSATSLQFLTDCVSLHQAAQCIDGAGHADRLAGNRLWRCWRWCFCGEAERSRGHQSQSVENLAKNLFHPDCAISIMQRILSPTCPYNIAGVLG